ncbi:MAG: hypothetical protein LUJ25_07155, partial [Firmicutes bacterium]|nr:hypothetical protein [Bacillota bacterium]
NTAIEDAFFVDCGVILDNSQGEIEIEDSSLAHLIGKTVSVLNVGSPEMGHTVMDPDQVSEPEPEPEPDKPDNDDIVITPPEDGGGDDDEEDDGVDDDFTVETPEEPPAEDDGTEPDPEPDKPGDGDEEDDNQPGETTSYNNCHYENCVPSSSDQVLICVCNNSCVDVCCSCFICNRGFNDGGVARMNSGSCLTICKSVFCNNISPNSGGVISATDATLNICDSEFTANCAYCCAATNESAIENISPYADDDDSFGTGGSDGEIDWTGQCAPAIGGALYSVGENTITINNSCFCKNEGSCGGAIGLITGQGSCLTICNSCFEENCGLDSGGGVYVRCTPGTSACIDCSSFTQNYAAWGGAGVALECCACAHISNSEFCCNCSKFYGGGLYVNNCSCAEVCKTCFCNDNSRCGAIFVCCHSNVVLHDVCVESDTPSLGLNVGANSCVTLCGCNVFCNSNICLSNASFLCVCNGCFELWDGTVCCADASWVFGTINCCTSEKK